MEAPTAPKTDRLTGGDLAIRAEATLAAAHEEAKADRRSAGWKARNGALVA